MADIVALADMVERLGVQQVLTLLTEVKEFDASCGISAEWDERDKIWIDRVARLLAGAQTSLPFLQVV